jgi:excisionase family DNA binding protein
MVLDFGSDVVQDIELSLSEAAQFLGVHAATLRRWANAGAIPYLLTPGGHRRFARQDLETFTRQNRHATANAGLEQLWAERAMLHTRQELVDHSHSRWLQAYDEEHRDQERMLGRRLMGVTLQYINHSTEESAQALLEEAREIGHAYARNAISHHLSVVAALEAAMFFHDAMLEVAVQLPQTGRLQAGAHTNLLRKINKVLNTVQLAIAQTYQDTGPR